MLELYHNDMSSCAQKVRVALAELGLAWKSRHLNLRGDEQLRPEYLRINPKGQIPALVDGELVVVESTVINEYLVDAFAGEALLPVTAADRAKMRWWSRQPDEDVHTSVGIMSQSISFMHQYLKNTPEMLDRILARIPDESRREAKKLAFATGMKNPELPKSARRADKLLADMEAWLGGNEWLAGTSHSLADIAIIPYVVRLEQLQQTMMFERRPRLADWLARMKARPGYAGITDWLNGDYLALMEETGAQARPLISEMIGR
jgi:glutathione S-transferase